MKTKKMSIMVVLSVFSISGILYAQQEQPPNIMQPKADMKCGMNARMDQNKGRPEMGARETRDGHHSMRMNMGKKRPQMDMPIFQRIEHARNAGATEEQISTISEVMFSYQIMRIDLQAKSEKAQLKLMRLNKQNEQNIEATMQMVDILNQARGEMFKQDILTKMKVRNILGKDIYDRMKKDRPRGSMGGHRNNSPKPCEGPMNNCPQESQQRPK